MDDARRALDDLRAKYETILRLRVAHGSADEPDPRADMAALAERFPGALRELDALPLDEVRARIDELRARLDAPALPAWVEAQARFHAAMRGALRAKRWLDGRRDVDGDVRARYVRDVCASDVDAAAWADDLASVASPPRGRLVDLAIARVGRAMSITPSEARALVFGSRR